MKSKKLLAFLLVFVFVIGILSGCGATAKDSYTADAPAAEAPMENAAAGTPVLTDSTQDTASSLPGDRKLITTVNMDAETEDLDGMLTHINSKIAALGGYMESQEIYNGSAYSTHRYRNASLTIRIPAENLSQFVDMVSENCNIISNYKTSEDVTLTYVSIESRISALEIEQDRLMELLERADTMEDLLTIESRLTDVRYELEEINSRLRVMENQINYSTIHLYLSEVKEYTEVEEPETFGQRIASGFVKNVKALWNFVVEFVIFLIVALPFLIPLGAIAVLVVFIIKKSRKHKKQKKQKPDAPQEEKPE